MDRQIEKKSFLRRYAWYIAVRTSIDDAMPSSNLRVVR